MMGNGLFWRRYIEESGNQDVPHLKYVSSDEDA